MKKDYYLTSFEPENAYKPREVLFERFIKCGNRDDYVIAKILPPLEGELFGKKGNIDRVVLAPRHKGISIMETTNWPIHVYVCVIKKKDILQNSLINPDELSIINWGLLNKGVSGTDFQARPQRV